MCLRRATSDAELWRKLLGLAPMVGAWVISFAFVLVFWVAHHGLFSQIERIDRGTPWLSGLFR